MNMYLGQPSGSPCAGRRRQQSLLSEFAVRLGAGVSKVFCQTLLSDLLVRLGATNFICINGEKCFRTVWKELAQEFPEDFDHCVEQTLWNTTREGEMRRPLTQEEEMQRKKGIPREQITQSRLWNKRPDGIAFKIAILSELHSRRIPKWE